MRCNKTVTPDLSKPKRVTYCQLELLHEGPCSPNRPRVPAAAPPVIRREKLGRCEKLLGFHGHMDAEKPHVKNNACFNWREL